MAAGRWITVDNSSRTLLPTGLCMTCPTPPSPLPPPPSTPFSLPTSLSISSLPLSPSSLFPLLPLPPLLLPLPPLLLPLPQPYSLLAVFPTHQAWSCLRAFVRAVSWAWKTPRDSLLTCVARASPSDTPYPRTLKVAHTAQWRLSPSVPAPVSSSRRQSLPRCLSWGL